MFRSCVLIALFLVVSVNCNTPAPAPASGSTSDNANVNPDLIGHCCAPGRCNTDTTTTHTDPDTGVTTGSAADCAQFTDSEGDVKSTVDYKTCKANATSCQDPAHSCGGYSGTSLVPGEFCSAKSQGMVCCVAGKAGQGAKCAQGTMSDGKTFDSSSWLECKYQSGCENSQNMCGGFSTAGVWVKAGKYGPSPAPSTKSKDSSSGGGLSTGVIIGIAIGSLALIGIAMMMFSGSSQNQNHKEGYIQQGDDYVPPSDAAAHHGNDL